MLGTYENNGNRRRAFTVKDLAVASACLLVAASCVLSLSAANRDLSQATVCAGNQATLFGGLTAYVNTYNSYPPHNPYPTYAPSETVNGISTAGWDPNLGWILTYGLGLEPPARFADGHFKWFGLDPDDLPDVVTCPAAGYEKLFTPNPEISVNNLESFVYTYAAFYQTSGTMRSATPIIGARSTGGIQGGRNPVIPNPAGGLVSMPAENANGGIPYVWVCANNGDPANPSAFGIENSCWVQAIHPAEVQDPGRTYYLADARDYRPEAGGWPTAANNDGWLNGYGNKVYLGTRHYGYANVMYLDGNVARDNQAHPILRWNLDYSNGQARSPYWRCATFATNIDVAFVHTQVHVMPVLMVKGWEYFFSADGVAAK